MQNDKNVVLLTCFHTFCKECMDKNIKNRTRMCLQCHKKVNKNQIHQFYLD